jgi:hypothetical protein
MHASRPCFPWESRERSIACSFTVGAALRAYNSRELMLRRSIRVPCLAALNRRESSNGLTIPAGNGATQLDRFAGHWRWRSARMDGSRSRRTGGWCSRSEQKQRIPSVPGSERTFFFLFLRESDRHAKSGGPNQNTGLLVLQTSVGLGRLLGWATTLPRTTQTNSRSLFTAQHSSTARRRSGSQLVCQAQHCHSVRQKLAFRRRRRSAPN